MTSRDFCYWLQGFFEIGMPTNLTQNETEMVRRHLSLVFKHEIDPSFGDKEKQESLNILHGGDPLARC